MSGTTIQKHKPRFLNLVGDRSPETVYNYTDVGVHFKLDESNGHLYSDEGYLLLRDVKMVSPIKNNPRKAVAQVKKDVFWMGETIKNYEVVSDDSGELVGVYKIASDRDVKFDTDYEPIDFLPIPEYKKFRETMDNIEGSERPYLSVQKDQWVWRQDVRDMNSCVCSAHDCENRADIRVHAEDGRSIGRYMVGESTVNNYCRYCMDIDPEMSLVESYHRRDVEHVNIDDGYRVIAEDESSSLHMIVSVSAEGSINDSLGEYFLTVELVRGDTGHLVDRETLTVHRSSPKKAAERAVELYQSFWSRIHEPSLSFKLIKSRTI